MEEGLILKRESGMGREGWDHRGGEPEVSGARSTHKCRYLQRVGSVEIPPLCGPGLLPESAAGQESQAKGQR